MQKIPYQTGHYTTTNKTMKQNKTTGTILCQVVRTDFVGPIMYPNKNRRREKGIHTSFHMQFNKSNPFRTTARSNHKSISS